MICDFFIDVGHVVEKVDDDVGQADVWERGGGFSFSNQKSHRSNAFESIPDAKQIAPRP